MENLGKVMLLLGGIFLALGALFSFGGKFGWLGRLPGDFHFEQGGVTFYFPLATSILLSLLITLLLNLFRRY